MKRRRQGILKGETWSDKKKKRDLRKGREEKWKEGKNGGRTR